MSGNVIYGGDAKAITFYRYSDRGMIPRRLITFHIPDHEKNQQMITIEDYAYGQLYLVLTSLEQDRFLEVRAGMEIWLDPSSRPELHWLGAGPESVTGDNRPAQPGVQAALNALGQ